MSIGFDTPSLRTGRADFPHPALQSVVLPARDCRFKDMKSPTSSEAPAWLVRQHPCPPVPRFVLLSSASGPSPAVLAIRQYCRFLSAWAELHVSTFLHPFAPPALPGFIATMSALTPAWEARPRGPFCSSRRAVPWNPFSSLCPAGLLASRVLSLQSLPSPTTPLPPMIALTPNPSASWASCSHRPGLRLSTAGSPVSVAESSLLPLRTTPSPPVAPHPASRRRSYGWLQAGVGLPEEDLHLLEQNALASARWPGQARP